MSRSLTASVITRLGIIQRHRSHLTIVKSCCLGYHISPSSRPSSKTQGRWVAGSLTPLSLSLSTLSPPYLLLTPPKPAVDPALRLTRALAHIPIERVNRTIRSLPRLGQVLIQSPLGLVAVGFQLAVDFAHALLGILHHLVELLAGLGGAGLGFLLGLGAAAGEVRADFFGEFGGVGWLDGGLVVMAGQCGGCDERQRRFSTFKLLLGDVWLAAGVVEVVSDSCESGTTRDLPESTAGHDGQLWCLVFQ